MANHRLVAIGDSLTQGFMSGAVCATDLSYPVLVARAMGLQSAQFRIPSFSAFGGLPVNIEYLLRRLGERYGNNLNVLELLGAPLRLRGWMDEAEDYWERGSGTAPRHTSGTFHNLASWGMTVDDVLHLTARYCAERCAEPTQDDLFNQIPENAFYRTALTVLNPAQRPELMSRTVLHCVKDLADRGGIENLLVALGANNALGTVTQLQMLPTDEQVLTDPLGSRTRFNLWRPEHFAVVYQQLAAALDAIHADRVFLATVPHVTIAPLARGVGTRPEDRLPQDARYFKFYTYFWIADDVFDPRRHRHLTGAQAHAIDACIDAYNGTIRDIVQQHQQREQQWFLVDLAGALERLAFRRYRELGVEPPGGRYEFPAGWLQALQVAGIPELTTEYIVAEQNRLRRGGIFSLDGVHPTTMGYGLIGQEFIRVMREEANVPFLNPLTGAELPDPIQIDYMRLLQQDTLVRTPPGLLDDTVAILNWLDGWIGLSGILSKVA